MKRLLLLSLSLILILGLFIIPSQVHKTFAAVGTVCFIQPNEFPTATACPAAPEVFNGPNTDTAPKSPTQIRVGVFISGSDPLNGFDITLREDPAILRAADADLTGSIIPTGFTVLAKCLDGVLVLGSTCQPTDTVGTLHFAVIGPGGFISPNPALGLLFTATYNIVGTTVAPGIVLDYQTGCTGGSVGGGVCITISNGTPNPSLETTQNASFDNSSPSPYVTLDSGAVTTLGQVFVADTTNAVTLNLTPQAGWGAQISGTAVTLSSSSTGAGISGSFQCTLAGCPNNPDLVGVLDNTPQAVTFNVAVGGTALPGSYTVTATVSYTSTDSLTTLTNTLSESVTLTITVVDFTYAASGPTAVTYWCPTAYPTVPNNCPSGNIGSTTFAVTPRGYTGNVVISTVLTSPVTTPALTTTYTPSTITGASGSSTATFTLGRIPACIPGVPVACTATAATGTYSVTTRATGTLPSGSRTINVIISVRPQDFNVTNAPATVSFASGSTGSSTLTIGSSPSSALANINNAGFAGPVTLSSTVTGGTGLNVAFATNPVTLAPGQKLTDVVTYSGTVTTTTTFTVTITGTATLPGATPTTQTHSVTVSVTITAVSTTHPTSATVACTPSPVAVNAPTSCTATVTDTSTTGATAPTGTVTFTPGGPCTLSGTGASATCSVNVTPTAVGSLSISASYGGDSTHGTSSGSTIVTVITRSTTTTVLCTPSSVPANAPTSCTATVADTAAGTASAPTGTVTFTPTATCTLAGTGSSASCSASITPSTVGTLSVSVSYPGDTVHAASASTTSASVTVTKRTTTVAVNCTPATPGVNAASTCTATVTDNAAGTASTPTGTVTWTHTNTGAFLSATCTLSGTAQSSSCTATYTAAATGTHVITAAYGGDTNHDISSNSFTISVALNPTSTTVACTPTTVVVGQSTSCTATVTDTSTTPTTPIGTVTFSPSGTCALAGTGSSASCSTSITPTTAGTLTVSASYGGDATHAGSSSTTSASVTVNKRATTISVTCTPASIHVGQTTQCGATVTDSDAGTASTPSGPVTFSPAATCILSGTGSQALCTATEASTPFPPSLFVTATYGGDSTHLASGPSAAFTVTVNPRTTSTTVSCPTSGTVGSAFSCTVTVTDTDTGTSSTPTGIFMVNGVSCTLAGSGTAASCQISITPTALGPLTITANYPGDLPHATSTGSATVTISPAAAHVTTTAVVCDQTVVVGQPSLCTTTVTDTTTTGATSPLGTVTWSLAAGTQGTGTFDSPTCALAATTATASSCTVHFTSNGPGGDTFNIQAGYGGDATHASSSIIVTIAIAGRSTSATITCTTPVTVGTASTCNVTITDTSPAPAVTPIGNFPLTTSGSGFFDHNCQTAGTGAVTTCTVNYTPSATGTHTITAVFPTGGAFSYNTAGTFDITANPSPLHSTTTTVSCTPNPVHWGSLTTCTATVTDTSTSPTAPTGTVSFTSSGTGIFSPTSCTLTGATSPTSCTVTYTPQVINPTTDALPRSDSITGTNGGDTTHSVSDNTVAPEILSVTKRATSTSVDCVPSTITTADSSTCTIQAADADTQPPVFGVGIQFARGTFTATMTGLPGASLGCSGNTCTCTPNLLPYLCTLIFTSTSPGTASITATYSGDSIFLGSTSPATTVTVSLATIHTTTTTVSCIPSIIVIGQSTLCTATVTDASVTGATTPGGTVTFTPSGTCTLSGTGAVATCSVSISFTTAGAPKISATYSGDATHDASTNATGVTVNVRATSTTVSCLPSSVNTGSPSTCTATVTDSSGIGTATTPTGTVDFTTGGAGTFATSPCTLSPGTTGTASCFVTYTPTGTAARTDIITADYAGDTTHATSNNNAGVAVTVGANPTSTTVDCSPSTVALGVPTTCSATVTDTSASPTAPTGTVTFTPTGTCTLAGTGTSVSCSINVTPTTAGLLTVSATYGGDSTHSGSSGTTTVTVTTPDFSITATSPAAVTPGTSATSTITVTASGGFTGTVALTDTVPAGLTCAAITPSSLTNSGTATVSCSSTTAGTYTITPTGTSGTLSHSTTATFTITQQQGSDFTITLSPSSLTLVQDTDGRSKVTLKSINGFTAELDCQATVSPNGATADVVPDDFDLSANRIGTTRLKVFTEDSTPVGTYKVTVTCQPEEGGTTHSATLDLTVIKRVKAPSFTDQKLSWMQNLDLSKTDGKQTFTATVRNNDASSPVYVQVLVLGRGSQTNHIFSAQSQIVLLNPGQTTQITFSGQVDNSFIGSRVRFIAGMLYSSTIDSSGNLVVPNLSLSFKIGCFNVVAPTGGDLCD